ncbi:MAG: Fic family protein [Fibrobacter sp.]|nr:Fic family protein [Fibrobacter sp.]
MDFDKYIKNVPPSKKEKCQAWQTAIGLQAVDQLQPSAYLYETAQKNIDGELSFEEVQNLIKTYYESKISRNDDSDERTEEADKVSARIAQILSEKSFSFSPLQLIAIHMRLFKGIFKFAGKIRDYDISKKEWVLNGDTVMYGSSYELKATLDYDFEQEKNFSYKNLDNDQVIVHIAKFISGIWQIHAFGEGNTRTIAVFLIKYLGVLGYKVKNESFVENSWYFRNALVRANYNNLKAGIHETTEYLELFLRNLLLGEHNELKNRTMHITYKSMNKQNDNVKLSENQKRILQLIKDRPYLTQKELSENIGITVANINRNMKKLGVLGLIRRIGADKNGCWEVLEK